MGKGEDFFLVMSRVNNEEFFSLPFPLRGEKVIEENRAKSCLFDKDQGIEICAYLLIRAQCVSQD